MPSHAPATTCPSLASSGARPLDKVAALFIKEIEEGIEDTGVRAGIIKVASDRGGVTENEETVLRAAARACNATGTRISTHTWSPDRVGEEQVRILKDEGVDLNRVYVGHSNDDTDVEYLIGLLEEGVWLGLDRYPGGRTPETPRWEVRTEIVKRLIDAGWAHRLMLSHDHSTPLVQPSDELRREREVFNPRRLPVHHPQRFASPDRTRSHRRRREHHDGGQPPPLLRGLITHAASSNCPRERTVIICAPSTRKRILMRI